MSCTTRPLLRQLVNSGGKATFRTAAIDAATGNETNAPRRQRRDQQRGNAAPTKPRQSLPELLGVLGKLKAEGRTPTPAAYLALIQSAADYNMRRGLNAVPESSDGSEKTLGLEIALGAMRDAEAGGIDLGTKALDEMFRFVALEPSILPSLLIEVANSGKPTEMAYRTMAQQAIGSGRLEQSILIFVEMLSQNYIPPRSLVKSLVHLACEWGMPRLALQAVERTEQLPDAPKSEASVWVDILTASANAQFMDGIVKGWARCVQNKALAPDEGLILQVLGAAGRWGRTDLAADALGHLPAIGVQAQEHHLKPLIQAFCRAGRVPAALKLVSQLRTTGIEPTMSTVQPIIDILNTPELLDQAFYTLEDMHKAGETVDVAALNAVIAAAEKLDDLQRARATQLAAADLGVTPNADTFNTVIAACRGARHVQLGESVLSEMSAADVVPTAKSYENMIHLYLTQANYETAFWYLEKMKAEGFKPPADLYRAIGRKCFRNNDPRFKLVADEMATVGYPVPNFEADAKRSEERAKARRKASENGESHDNNNQRRRRDDRQRKPNNRRNEATSS